MLYLSLVSRDHQAHLDHRETLAPQEESEYKELRDHRDPQEMMVLL